MSIDTTKIDAEIARQQEQIRKLQELKRFASDPELLPLLQTLITPNPSKLDDPKMPVVRQTRKSHNKGEFLRTVQRTIATLNGGFNVAAVVDEMRKNGYTFASKNNAVAVGGALRKLTTKGDIRVALTGSGRTGHRYERVIKTSSGD